MKIFYTIVAVIILVLLFKFSVLSIVGVLFAILTISCLLASISSFKDGEIISGILWAIPTVFFLILIFK
ncbi:MAG: hypothetical protein BHW00_04385 [Clostridium sp. 26_22]|nr:MAG: hypothetical protein BHW00_04385 [Clostridium sp. 26_22]